MARDKALLVNIDGSDLVNYPNKRIRNNTGAGDGTPVNEITNGDFHEFFAKLMRLNAITYNGLPDNETNGYQLVDAIKALASKNDFVLNLAEAGGLLTIPVKLGLVLEGESFICLAQVDQTSETQLIGTLDTVTKAITFKGGAFKTGEYLRVVITAAGVDIIRLSDGDAFQTIANEFGYLKAATQPQEDAGAINTVATSPLTNFTAFALRVNGLDSVNFLATLSQNGLLSAADKAVIDGIASPERNYGTFGPFDVDSGTVGQNYAISGDITLAQITQRTTRGQVVTVTVAFAMANNTYQVSTDIESNGNIELDNDVNPLVFKIINPTQFEIYVEETSSGVQSIKIHVQVIQR